MNYILSNGVKIQVKENSPVLITKSIADILEPEKRKRDMSKEIELPGTATNLEFFRGYFSFTSTDYNFTFDATKKVKADYYSNGTNIFANCFIKLNEVTMVDGNIYFSINLFSELKNLFLELRKVDVKDLDYTSMNHTFGKTAIKNSWNFTDGYVYPLIDAGNRSYPDTWLTTDFYPYVTAWEIIQRMLIKVGVNPSDFVFSTDLTSILKGTIYGFGGGERLSISALEIAERLVDVGGTMEFDYNGQIFPQASLRNIKANFNATTTDTTTSNPIGQYSNYEIAVGRSGRYKVSIDINGTSPFSSTPDYILMETQTIIFRNGIEVNRVGGGSSTSFNFINEIDIDLQSGDVIDFGFYPLTGVDSTGGNLIRILPDYVSFSQNIKMESLDTEILDGAIVNVGDALPSMNCADFLNGLIMLGNLYFSDIDIDGKTHIDSLNSFYSTNANDTEDLTNLVDDKKEIKFIPLANEFEKTIKFKFKENKDFENQTYFDKFGENYGDLTIENSSDFATGEKVFQLPFSNIVPCNYIAGVDAVIPRFVTAQANGTFKPNKGAPRIAVWNGLRTGYWNFKKSDGTDLEVMTDVPVIHHFDDYENPKSDLNWQLVKEVYYTADLVTVNNLYNLAYKQFIDESISKDSRLVKLSVKYNDLNIKNINFQNLRFYKGTFYRLNKVIDYNGNTDAPTTTAIELIRVLKPRVMNTPTFNPVIIPIPDQPIKGDVAVGYTDAGSVTAVTDVRVNGTMTEVFASGDSALAEVNIATSKQYDGYMLKLYNSGLFPIAVGLDTVASGDRGVFVYDESAPIKWVKKN